MSNQNIEEESLAYEDGINAGIQMHELAEELFPLNRTIMGPDIRQSYAYFRRMHIEFEEMRFKTGEKVFDWDIPEEWIINDAYIRDMNGKKYAEFKKNNLHIMGYSIAKNCIMNKEELLKHIHTHPTMDDAIPYVTSYYKKDWGFCLEKRVLETLPDGDYHVYIDSKHVEGYLAIQEALIPGESDREIFFSSYLCHPTLANNELSGPVLISQLLKYIKRLKNRKYTYRIALLPETIGSIAYLSRRREILKKNVICGLNLSCVGDERCYSHIASRYNDTLADHALKAALIGLENVKYYSFLSRGSDERQYCAPGIDLPICTFCRSKFGEYDEYHSSKDDFSVVSKEGLTGSYNVVKSIINAFENGVVPINNILCEPQLGKRGLYPNTSKLYTSKHPAEDRMNILCYCDGRNTIFEICKMLNLNLQYVVKEVLLLKKEGLISCSDYIKSE